MANAYKCDRCGALYEPYGHSFGDRKAKFSCMAIASSDVWGPYDATVRYDLCPGCVRAILDFLTVEVKTDGEKV